MREKTVEARLRHGVEKMGGACLKWTSPGQDGVPDRIVILPGRVIFVEMKTETGKLSKVQEYQIDRLRRLKQTACVVYGAEGVRQFLRDLEEGRIRSVYGRQLDD